MRVTRIAADAVRSLEGVTLEPGPGVTVVIGPNGAGKTNLIEAIYFGLTTSSFRTSDRRDLIPFGSGWARCRVDVEDGQPGGGIVHRFMAGIDRSEGIRFSLDGAVVDRVEAARNRPAITVFSPDRLELIKGPPALRRSHLDAFVAIRWPHLADTRREYGRALAQRNALLAGIRDGRADRGQLPSWDLQVARTGVALAATRADAIEMLKVPWVEAATELGLDGAPALSYRPGGPQEVDELETALGERREADIDRGRTGIGPHHDELRVEFRDRQLRRFGSQGQQRLGLLALLFAEREVILASGRPAPLMLLDDVMSELDEERRQRLVARLTAGGQALLTAAEGELVPDQPGVGRVRMADLTAGSAGSPTTGEKSGFDA
ncbi:MAG: DNA replication and repair protein RecF [Solirubrobacterales bacterium]|nr:DNA replication and repair protein RecF [Solirubrobacterales bacterium]